MLHLENGIYVRIEQLPNGPKPCPLDSGFNSDTAYRVLGMFNPSETSDAYFILSNDRDEVWFICNRHVRCLGVLPELSATKCCPRCKWPCASAGSDMAMRKPSQGRTAMPILMPVSMGIGMPATRATAGSNAPECHASGHSPSQPRSQLLLSLHQQPQPKPQPSSAFQHPPKARACAIP